MIVAPKLSLLPDTDRGLGAARVADRVERDVDSVTLEQATAVDRAWEEGIVLA